MYIDGIWIGKRDVLELFKINQELQESLAKFVKDNRELIEANQHYVQEINDAMTIVHDIASTLEAVSQGKYYTSSPDAEERVYEIRLP